MSLTPSEIETAARSQYNAINDTFYSQSEILVYLSKCCNILARRAYVIERVYTTTSTAGTQEYAFPTNTIAIKRITYDGSKLYPITMREDDAITLSNSTTTQQGRSLYYAIFNYTLALRPIPDTSSLSIKVYGYNTAAPLTITSTLEVPAVYHYDLIDGVVAQMAAKDQNYDAATYYNGLFMKSVKEAEMLEKKRRRADSFATVQDESSLPTTIIGAV
jgi:hypothetical protein